MTERMVLRAELFHESRHIVGHTTTVTTRSAFVRTDERLELGATVELLLSFPRLFAPLRIDARVSASDAGNGHGYFPGFVLDFTSEQERVSRLLAEQEVTTRPDAYRILVVEDSAVLRDLMQVTVKRWVDRFAIEIDSTDTAEQALACIDTSSYDLALVDLYLPGALTGADLVREVRTRRLDLPIIGFSVGGPEARRAFLDAGADLFLDKPIMLRDVFGTLERLVLAARSNP